MKSTQISPEIQNGLQSILDRYTPACKLIDDLYKAGARVYLVGGAVRDLVLHQALKDLDIEVHQLPLERVEQVMSSHGIVSLVGKSFGVFRLHGLDIDWSLPRTDSYGRKPTVDVDPNMGIEAACKRRDVTINAMAIDLHTFELIDPYGGRQDLEHCILRATDPELFVQDPLRFFRVMQFISRFEMQPTENLDDLCRSMDITGVSRERIEQEFHKMMLKSIYPSRGLRWLASIKRLVDILPELYMTRGVAQNPVWHPEGDVFEHTMQALDAAAQITVSYTQVSDRLIVLYAALCHDLAKATTSHVVDGVIKSELHAQAGVALARTMLKRITNMEALIDAVAVLVRYHMEPLQFIKGHATISAYKRLARKLAPHATLALLADLASADTRGRNPNGHEPLAHEEPGVAQFRASAQRAAVLEAPEKPVLQGRDFLDVVSSGPELGKLVRKAYEIQLDEGITDADLLKKRVLGS